MKERPTFYKKLIQMKENFRFYLRCFYCITTYIEQNGYVNNLNKDRLHHEIYMSDARKLL